MSKTLNPPYFVALDIDNKEQVINLAQTLKDKVGGFKIGPRLLLKHGESLAKELSAIKPLFIDHKFYDIPNTMLSSIQTSFDIGASFVTIHGAAGLEAMKQIKDLEDKLNKIRPFKILVVTVITSFSEETKPTHWQNKKIDELILEICSQVHESGLTGVVCSPFEAALVKKNYPHFYIVTPGIRLAEDSLNDQKRVMTPSEALSVGADSLVIGRTIVHAKEPQKVVDTINAQLA